MENKEDKPKGMKPLLLKLGIPIAFSIAGFIFSSILTKSSNRNSQSNCLNDISPVHEFGEEEEEEEIGGEPSSTMQNSPPLEILRMRCPESARDVPVQEVCDDSTSEEDIEHIRRLAADVDGRQCELEAKFHEYCNMKEEESALQRFQIMCLDLTLESMESQNQRLERAITENKEAVEQVVAMRDEIRLLEKKVMEISILACNGREEEVLIRGNEELRRATEEVREVADRLHDERKAIEKRIASNQPSNSSKTIEEAELSNNSFLVELEQFRDRLSADTDKLILYLAWVDAYLRREVHVQSNGDEDMKKPSPEWRDQLVMELPVDDRVATCTIEIYDSDGSSVVVADQLEEACLTGGEEKCRQGSSKPKLLSKIKGWATGKGRCKKP